MNRRELLQSIGALTLARCAGQSIATAPGRLTARPARTRGADSPVGRDRLRVAPTSGTFPLGLAVDRDGLVLVPASYRSDHPAPLVVMLHGAGGMARRVIENQGHRAEEFGVIVIAPESRGETWDAVRGEFGEDVRFIDRALERIFAGYNIDARHLAIGGFSDGASYALSLGITNGDLFSHIIAFSPGFATPASQHGAPRIFLSHGTEDSILPIDATTRRLLPRLREAGYQVRYEEFDGPHTVPADVARRAFEWFTR